MGRRTCSTEIKLRISESWAVSKKNIKILNIIIPHYRSEGRRQVSGDVFGGCMAQSEDHSFFYKCHKKYIGFQCMLHALISTIKSKTH